jgi:hypothetical protein
LRTPKSNRTTGGHFREPRAGHEIGLGTPTTRKYIEGHRPLRSAARRSQRRAFDVRRDAIARVLCIEKEVVDQTVRVAGIPEQLKFLT